MVNKILSEPIIKQYSAVAISRTYTNMHENECEVCAIRKCVALVNSSKTNKRFMGK